MATEFQIVTRQQGGGRILRVQTAALSVVAGVIGVTGATLTAGSGYTNGVYPLVPVGGTLTAANMPVVGTYTISGGALTALSITNPGQYTAAPTGFSFAAAGSGTGAAAAPTTAQVAFAAFPVQSELFSLPPGSRITNLKAFTSAAMTGSPTNAYVSVGASLYGQDYAAQTDAKTPGQLALTLAPTGLPAIRLAGLQTGQTIYATLVINGGSNAVAGTIELEIHYLPPNVFGA